MGERGVSLLTANKRHMLASPYMEKASLGLVFSRSCLTPGHNAQKVPKTYKLQFIYHYLIKTIACHKSTLCFRISFTGCMGFFFCKYHDFCDTDHKNVIFKELAFLKNEA
jgi:hypothetical protein